MAQVSTENPGQNPYDNPTPFATDAERDKFIAEGLAEMARLSKSDEIVVDEHGREIPDPNDKPTRAEPLVD